MDAKVTIYKITYFYTCIVLKCIVYITGQLIDLYGERGKWGEKSERARAGERGGDRDGEEKGGPRGGDGRDSDRETGKAPLYFRQMSNGLWQSTLAAFIPHYMRIASDSIVLGYTQN